MPNTPAKRGHTVKQFDLSQVPAEVRELIPDEVLESMPEPQLLQIIERSQTFSGPLPPPDVLARYGEIKSDLPERITKMAEEHNQADVLSKNRFSRAMSFATVAGPVFSFILGIGSIAAAIWLALIGQTGTSIAAIIGGFAPIIIASISNLKSK
ncbi:MAG: DUF2335 domain-containing protein [Treponema sp.]|nr:MAG: DUF2335 domain-containing protein [Treponema sp.]